MSNVIAWGLILGLSLWAGWLLLGERKTER